MYAHLGFKNYYSECFIHVMNFFANWPAALRELLSNNCSIKSVWAEGIELDAFVEAQIVQPLKIYMSCKDICTIYSIYAKNISLLAAHFKF